MRGTSILIAIMLLSIPFISAAHENVIVYVRTYGGDMETRTLAAEDAERIKMLFEKTIENLNMLPALLYELQRHGLLNDAESIIDEIYDIAANGTKAWERLNLMMNAFCLVAGYGINSWIETPTSLLTIFLYTFFEKIGFPSMLLKLLFYSIYFYAIFTPKIYLPAAAWIVAGSGKICSLGLLGYQNVGVEDDDLPSVYILLRFVGVAVTFVWKGYEETYVAGATMAVVGI